MQQTRIEQGAPYYLRFIARFPDVHTLASAPVDEVLRYWQGLGYYTRARNLHAAAVYVVKERNGAFPVTYDELIKMPGVGPYSAAAIASFAYHLPYPVVDGNVKRVIARYAGVNASIDESATHQQIYAIAKGYMSDADPALFNQAIMNFGALVCTPRNPDCGACALSKKCFAFQHDAVTSLPLRSKKKSNRARYFHFVVIHWRGKTLLARREDKDIWRGLYAPPVLENNTSRSPSVKQLLSVVKKSIGHDDATLTHISDRMQQQLSHQTIIGQFHYLTLLSAPPLKLENAVWVNKKTIQDVGKPRIVVEGLDIGV